MTDNLISINSALLNNLVEHLIKRLKEELTPHVKEPEWIDSEKAMQILRIKKTTLQSLRSSNVIRHSFITPKTILYSTHSISEYIESKITNYEK